MCATISCKIGYSSNDMNIFNVILSSACNKIIICICRTLSHLPDLVCINITDCKRNYVKSQHYCLCFLTVLFNNSTKYFKLFFKYNNGVNFLVKWTIIEKNQLIIRHRNSKKLILSFSNLSPHCSVTSYYWSWKVS